jgi:hypothetical protein
MEAPPDKIPLGITEDKVALGSHLIHFWQNEDEFERGVIAQVLGPCLAAPWIFSASRYAAKLYLVPYTWRCNRTTDHDVFGTARPVIGRPLRRVKSHRCGG